MKKILLLATLATFIINPVNAQQYNNAYGGGVSQSYTQMKEMYNDLQNQLSSAVDEINRLQAENYGLKRNQGSATGAAVSIDDSGVVYKLQQQLSQKNHEVQMLRNQLSVANSNLAHYRASGRSYAVNNSNNYDNSGIANNNRKKNFFKRMFRR